MSAGSNISCFLQHSISEVVRFLEVLLNWELGKSYTVSENYAIGNGQNFKEGA